MKSGVQYVAKFEIIFIQNIICVFISKLQGFGGAAPDQNSDASVIVI